MNRRWNHPAPVFFCRVTLDERLDQIYRSDISLGYMDSISLELPSDLLRTSDRYAKLLGIPRAEYIRRALERMNREVEARTRAERMARASRKVRHESMRVNAEFARIKTDSEA
jgi:metal-responsive CopG/Arc/MetJ family transcriptional regulator